MLKCWYCDMNSWQVVCYCMDVTLLVGFGQTGTLKYCTNIRRIFDGRGGPYLWISSEYSSLPLNIQAYLKHFCRTSQIRRYSNLQNQFKLPRTWVWRAIRLNMVRIFGNIQPNVPPEIPLDMIVFYMIFFSIIIAINVTKTGLKHLSIAYEG